MDELWSDIHLEGSHLNCLVDNQLKEELIDTLEMWPCWVNLVLCLDSCFRELQVRLLHVWKWSENVFLDHGHHIVEMWDDKAYHSFLVLEQLLDLVNSIETLCLTFDILGLILVVVVLLANQKFLLEGLFGVLVGSTSTGSVSRLRAATGGSSLARTSSA